MIKEIKQALGRVVDPELGIDIVSLGLIYKISVRKSGDTVVRMTLTSPGCPLASMIDIMVKTEVKKVKGIGEVRTELIWDPPWVPDMMSDEAKAELGFD